MDVGKPNYDQKAGSRTKFFRLGMSDDQRYLVQRIAPPVKTLAESGRYAYYVKQHFGYVTKNKTGKSVYHPFLCIEKKDKNGNITETCPECEERRLRIAEIDSKEAALKTKGVPAAQIEAQLQPLKSWVKDHNLDRKWYIVSKDRSNTWGYLTIGHKCYEALQQAIADIRKKGIDDPLDPKNGVWFEFSRSGTKYNELLDTVKVFTEQTGPGQFNIKFDEMIDTDWKQVEELPDVVTVGRKLTYDQIKMLVASGGEESVVKSVMESGQTRDNPNVTNVKTTSPTTTVVVPEQTGGAGGFVGKTAVDSKVAALEAELAALKAAQSKPAPAPTLQPSPTLTKQLEMSPEDFINEFNEEER